jgi:hypothetical protein
VDFGGARYDTAHNEMHACMLRVTHDNVGTASSYAATSLRCVAPQVTKHACMDARHLLLRAKAQFQ